MEGGLITATHKLKRAALQRYYAAPIAAMYAEL